MFDRPRVFRRSDPDFPTTRRLQDGLVAAGRVEGEGPLAPRQAALPQCRFCGHGINGDPNAELATLTCGPCRERQNRLTPQKAQASPPRAARTFTSGDRSLISKIHGYMPPMQLLGILNDRLRSDLGANVQPYGMGQLDAEIAALRASKTGGDGSRNETGWAGMRKLLAQARHEGTLDRINEQVVGDFAVVFSLSPKQLIQLKEILLQPKED